MNYVLTRLFCFIIGESLAGQYRPNWFSMRFHRWRHKKHCAKNRSHEEAWKECATFFEIDDYHKLKISNKPHWGSSSGSGYYIGVSWGMHGYIGTLLKKEEARKLVDHINKTIDQ